MAEHLPGLDDLEVRVMVLSFDDVDAAAAHRRALALPFPVASDRERSAYRAFGLERGSFLRVWHPRTLWLYTRLVARGMRLRRSTGDGDREQLGGDVVLDGEGRIVFLHRSRRPDDRPAITTLSRALREAATSANS